MIIFIKSAASYGIRREWIRNTWGSIGYLDGATFQIVFVIGQAKATTQALLDEEYNRYGDILQVEASDAYQWEKDVLFFIHIFHLASSKSWISIW